MIITILATAVVLGVLILVHELGHFWAAKAVDIEVPRFSIGLGPKLWGVRWGETEYVISWLPLGGYVKMAGMAEEEALEGLEGESGQAREPTERDFDAKPLWARISVISAGVVMNMIFAVLAFALYARSQGVQLPLIGEVEPGSAAAAAGLRPGDRLLRVDGKEIADWRDLQQVIQGHPGDTLPVELRRGSDTLTLRAAPTAARRYDMVSKDSVTIGLLGVVRDTTVGERKVSLPAAVGDGVRRTGEVTGLVYGFLWQLVTGKASARDLGGPILIGQLSGRTARAGFWPFLNFMALISVNLAVINFLPIPVLDGGHLLFLAIEGVRGKALSAMQKARWSQVGLILLAGLMLFAITNDLLRMFGS